MTRPKDRLKEEAATGNPSDNLPARHARHRHLLSGPYAQTDCGLHSCLLIGGELPPQDLLAHVLPRTLEARGFGSYRRYMKREASLVFSGNMLRGIGWSILAANGNQQETLEESGHLPARDFRRGVGLLLPKHDETGAPGHRRKEEATRHARTPLATTTIIPQRDAPHEPAYHTHGYPSRGAAPRRCLCKTQRHTPSPTATGRITSSDHSLPNIGFCNGVLKTMTGVRLASRAAHQAGHPPPG